MADLTPKHKNELRKARHAIGLYSIKELCEMFDCSRHNIDNAINTGCLKYVSPNNRDRYVYLQDFLSYMKTMSD